MKIDELEIPDPAALLRLGQVPAVLRARGFYLYTPGGKRLVDLWQYGGAAVLGHTPRSLLREIKNSAERGLFTPFPHPLEKRFIKALSRLFPGTSCRVYADEASLRRALARAGFTDTASAPFPDPAVGPASGEALSLWRPFLPLEKIENESPQPSLLIPVLPWALAPKAVIFEQTLDPHALGFPPSDCLSPVLLAGTTRAIDDLCVWLQRGRGTFPLIRRALSEGIWRQRGIYLHYGEALDEEAYTELFLRFLIQGFLLPPRKKDPLILPGSMSKGEEARLAALLQLS